MKDIKQIHTIHAALSKEKEKFMAELAKINQMIDNKLLNIQRMTIYQKEYGNTEYLKLSKVIPSLSKNLEAFSGKISDMIQQGEKDVDMLKNSRKTILQTIEKIDNKIRLMDLFADKARIETMLLSERREQVTMDDLASLKHVRGEEYE